MELVDQGHDLVHRSARGVVELEVIQEGVAIDVDWRRRKRQLPSRHTQEDRVLHSEGLEAKLVGHIHQPHRPRFRRQELVHFHVRVRVGDRRDYVAVSLLHWKGEPDGLTHRLGHWTAGVELVFQLHLGVAGRVDVLRGRAEGDVGLEVVKHRC
jgi:hypothetical protein